MRMGSGNNNAIINKINKLALTLLASSISFIIGKNAYYNAIDIMKIVVYASIRKLSIEGSSEELITLSKGKYCSPDVVQRRIHQKSVIEIVEAFNQTTRQICSILRKMRLLFGRVTVAIDFTDKPYYGDGNDPGVIKTRHQPGTNYCFRYITLSVVIGDAKITLNALPVNPLSDKTKLVDRLLTEAKRMHIRINLVLLDRSFFTQEIVKIMNKHRLRFLFPVIKNKLVKKMIAEAHKSKNYVNNYKFTKGKKPTASFNIFFILDPDSHERQIWKRYHVYGTNLPVDNNNRHIFAEIYRKRWNIETSFRVEKQEFLAQTSSKSYRFRLFLFLVAIILYNLWIVARIEFSETFYVRRWKISIFQMIYTLSSRLLRRIDLSIYGISGF
jgi:hypothetical protein